MPPLAMKVADLAKQTGVSVSVRDRTGGQKPGFFYVNIGLEPRD